MTITLLDNNTRNVILEKFITPKWFKLLFSKRTHLLHNNSLLETYRIFLRILHGADLTITGQTYPYIPISAKAEINKWRTKPEKINTELASFLIEDIKIVGIDSGSFDFDETHFNVFARNEM